jgi:PDZ domain
MVLCILNNEIEVQGMIDTGSPYSIVLPLDYLDLLRETFTSPLIESVGEMAKWPMSKNDTSYLTYLNSLIIGDIEIQDVPVLFTDIFSIIIGKDILDEYICTIDYPHHQVQFQIQSDTKFESDYYIMDLKLSRKNDKVIVKGFWKDSPFDIAGLKVGSEILSVNNISIDDKQIMEIKDLIYNADTDKVLLKVKSDSGVCELKVHKSQTQ